jgi:hypothetical protein
MVNEHEQLEQNKTQSGLKYTMVDEKSSKDQMHFMCSASEKKRGCMLSCTHSTSEFVKVISLSVDWSEERKVDI